MVENLGDFLLRLKGVDLSPPLVELLVATEEVNELRVYSSANVPSKKKGPYCFTVTAVFEMCQ